jgi:hypothetical protein
MPSVEIGKRSVEVGKPGFVVVGQGVRGNESFFSKGEKNLDSIAEGAYIHCRNI